MLKFIFLVPEQMLFEKMEEQKIDILIVQDLHSSFLRMIFQNGVKIG